jgi:fluoroacetyl-CoA thioesterase
MQSYPDCIIIVIPPRWPFCRADFCYPRNSTCICGEEMKESLKPGIKFEHKFKISPSKTVPALYPESEEFAAMPEVFATGFLVGFLEWACIKAINPHLDWPKEQTVGIHIDVSHEAATPPGLEVTATVELIAVEGKKLIFTVEAHDGVDQISKGRHERFIINKEKFDARVEAKAGA